MVKLMVKLNESESGAVYHPHCPMKLPCLMVKSLMFTVVDGIAGHVDFTGQVSPSPCLVFEYPMDPGLSPLSKPWHPDLKI